MARIAVVNVPFYSHVGAMTRLTKVLAAQGHSLVAWGPRRYRTEIEEGGSEFRLHEPPMPRVVGFTAFAAALAGTTEEITEPLVEELYAEGPELLIHDSQVPWARVAGEFLGLPRIVSHPMFPIVSNERVRSAEEQAAVEDDREAAHARFEASWRAIARRWGVEFAEWGSLIHSTYDSDATLAFTTEEIVGTLEQGWHCIGPLMQPLPPAPSTTRRELVYACFGTSFNRRAEQFSAVIEGLAAEPVDVLVSMGRGKVPEKALGPLPPNVAVRDFVPGREVLARANVHITHGGCNSVHESLLAGVPMLFIPQAYDQFPLARRIEHLGAGIVVDEDPAAVRAGVRRLVEDGAFRARAAELGRHLAHYDSEARIASLVAQVLPTASAAA